MDQKNSRKPACTRGFRLFRYFIEWLWNLPLFDLRQNFFYFSERHAFHAKVYT